MHFLYKFFLSSVNFCILNIFMINKLWISAYFFLLIWTINEKKSNKKKLIEIEVQKNNIKCKNANNLKIIIKYSFLLMDMHWEWKIVSSNHSQYSEK